RSVARKVIRDRHLRVYRRAVLQPVSGVYIVEVAERIASQVRTMIGNETDVHHHVPWKLALDVQAPHSLHRIVRRREVELDACSSQGRVAVRRQWEAIGRN